MERRLKLQITLPDEPAVITLERDERGNWTGTHSDPYDGEEPIDPGDVPRYIRDLISDLAPTQRSAEEKTP